MSELREAELHHLIAGVLCLDFANTLYGHTETVHEYLFDYRDLVLWSRLVGIVSPKTANELIYKWEQSPNTLQEVFHHAIQIRERIFRIFTSIAHAQTPNEDDMWHLHQSWIENQIHSKLIQTETGFEIGWENNDHFDLMLWRITRSAVDLLISSELKHVKQCNRCDWLFVDQSRNKKRRWCSMSACGNRVKMSRRYNRSKKAN